MWYPWKTSPLNRRPIFAFSDSETEKTALLLLRLERKSVSADTDLRAVKPCGRNQRRICPKTPCTMWCSCAFALPKLLLHYGRLVMLGDDRGGLGDADVADEDTARASAHLLSISRREMNLTH